MNAAPVILLVGLLAPLAGLVPVLGTHREAATIERWVRGGLGLSLVAWLGLLVLDWPARIGALAPDRLAAAGAAGIVVVAMAAGRLRSATAGTVVGPAGTLLCICTCLTIDGVPSVAAVVAASAAVLAMVAAIEGRPSWTEGLAAAGVALLAVALRSLEGTVVLPSTSSLGPAPGPAGTGPLTALMVGGAVLVGVGAARRAAPVVLLVPSAAVVWLRVLPPMGGIDGLGLVAAVAGAALAAGAVEPIRGRLPAKLPAPPAALVLAVWAMAATVLPLTDAVMVAAVLAAVVTGVLLGRVAADACRQPGAGATPEWWRAPALGLATWLVMVPQAWSLSGEPPGVTLERYQEGVLVAVAAGLVAAVATLVWAARRRAAAPGGSAAWLAVPGPPEPARPAGPWPVVVTVTMLGMSAALLLPSLVP